MCSKVDKLLKIPVFCLKLGPISPYAPKLEVQFGAPDFVPLCDPRPCPSDNLQIWQTLTHNRWVCVRVPWPRQRRRRTGTGVLWGKDNHEARWKCWLVKQFVVFEWGGVHVSWGSQLWMRPTQDFIIIVMLQSPKVPKLFLVGIRLSVGLERTRVPKRPCFPKNCVRFLIRLCLPPPTWHRWHRAEGICQFQSPNSSTPMSEHVNVCNHPGPWNFK